MAFRGKAYLTSSTAALVIAAWAGCAGGVSPPAEPPPEASQTERAAPPSLRSEVKIEQFAYLPRSLTIAPGTTVVWTNRDDAPHTVTEDSRQFESAALDTDDAFERSFDRPGIYRYFCALHPHMTGEIVVRSETQAP
jgi:plastocyanin